MTTRAIRSQQAPPGTEPLRRAVARALVWGVVWATAVTVGPGAPLEALAQPTRGAADPSEGGGQGDPGNTDPAVLAAREQQLLAQYKDLEKTFLRLADLLAPSDPRRAAVLRSVFEQARDQEVGGRLDTIVGLLEKGQLLKAGTTQASAIEQLRELLALLEAGDSDRHLANTKEEVKQFLARVSKLIAKQRDIEGSTEAGAGEAQLVERQDALAGETTDLSRDLGGFAKRMEVRDAAGEPVPDSGKGKAEGKEGAGTGKKGSAESKEGEPDASDDAEKPRRQPEGDDGAGAGESKPGDGAEKGSDGDKSPGREGPEQKPSGNEGESAESTPGDGGESGGSTQPSPGGEPVEGKGNGAPGEEGEGQSQPDGDDESSRAQRTQKRLEAAAERMRKAEDEIEKAKRRSARQEQEKAIEELETARAELEEILRQMREQEVERLLVQLETRLRAMLRAEKAVLAAAEKLAAEPVGQPDRQLELEAARLGRDQAAVGADAVKALTLVRDDGSAVAIPEALEQVRDDAAQAAARLGRGDVGATTRGIAQDIVSNLEEMVAALEKAQRDQQQRQKGGAAGGRPAEPGEQPLVDKLSELKMIRSLQMRVNARTGRFAQVLGEGAEQAEEPELLDAVRRLSDRQRKIERAAHDIVSGLTE